MRTRPRLLLAALGLAVAAGLALGFTLTRGGPENALAQGRPGVLARGTFKTVTWATKGSVTLERNAKGQITLRFSRDFDTQRAPELFVHLGKKRFALQRAWGSQTYLLESADAATLRSTVEVFCEKCNKDWGVARLRPTRQA
jgi:hypothetical protein